MEQYLTPKQKQILEWIEEYLRQNQTMPSRREIALGLGLSSPATIQQHIEALEKKGFLKRGETGGSRALQWTARSKKLLNAIQDQNKPVDANSDASAEFEIPLLGSIAAGYPIEVFPHSRQIEIPRSLIRSSGGSLLSANYYALVVRGDSMIDEGILPDDRVILKKANTAKSGETVAALLNGEATLKIFRKGKAGPELVPANPKYPVIQVQAEDRFEIQGILVGLVRQY